MPAESMDEPRFDSVGSRNADLVVTAIVEIGNCQEAQLPEALQRLASSVGFKHAAIVLARKRLTRWLARKTICQSAEFSRTCQSVLQVVCESSDSVLMFRTDGISQMSESVEETQTYAAAGIQLPDRCTKKEKTVLLLVTDERDVTLSEVERKLLNTVGSLVSGALSRKESGSRPPEKISDHLDILTHDLRSPLSSILICADMLDSPESYPASEATRARAIRRIRENSRFMLHLISDLIDSLSIDEGRMVLAARVLDLRPLIQMSIERCSDQAAAKNIQIEVDDPGSPLEALVDPGKVSQILDNLLSNALKFSNQGTRVTVGVRRESREVRLWISDQGLGIRPAELGSLFKKFGCTSTLATGEEKSTGLGLYIVSEMARIHGGDVTVSSELGHGSTFTVRLPQP